MTSAYVPPHLRNLTNQSPATNQSSTPQFPQNNASFHGRNPRYNNNRSMVHSYSAPGNLNNFSDEKIEELFANNTENADMSVYEADVKVSSPINDKIEPIKQFPGCGINNLILYAVGQIGYKNPTAVQKYSIPYILDGNDVLVTSQTGSGKTAAYMLPVLSQLLTIPAYNINHNYDPVILVLAPTRELALQIKDETLKFTKETKLKTVCIIGGADTAGQIRRLRNGCDILIATPGRLIDIANKNCLRLNLIRHLILDEADRMLDMGFEPQIKEIIDEFDMPISENRQTLLFSATFPPEVKNLAKAYMKKNTTKIEVGIQDVPSLIEQRFVYVEDSSKLSKLLEKINEIQGQTLVFAERKLRVDKIEEYLYDEGCHVVAIHGDRDLVNRCAALKGFTSGKANIMIATDVAARGIDIQKVAHVINLDLPSDVDSYIHRIGRTGRAGRHGIATSFWNQSNVPFLHALIAHFKANHQQIPQGLENFERDYQRFGNRNSRGRSRGFGRDHSYDNVSYRH